MLWVCTLFVSIQLPMFHLHYMLTILLYIILLTPQDGKRILPSYSQLYLTLFLIVIVAMGVLSWNSWKRIQAYPFQNTRDNLYLVPTCPGISLPSRTSQRPWLVTTCVRINMAWPNNPTNCMLLVSSSMNNNDFCVEVCTVYTAWSMSCGKQINPLLLLLFFFLHNGLFFGLAGVLVNQSIYLNTI